MVDSQEKSNVSVCVSSRIFYSLDCVHRSLHFIPRRSNVSLHIRLEVCPGETIMDAMRIYWCRKYNFSSGIKHVWCILWAQLHICHARIATVTQIRCLFMALALLISLYQSFNYSFRMDWIHCRLCSRFHDLVGNFNQVRLLCDAANCFWQSSFALLLPSFCFVNLTISLALTMSGSQSLPFYVYAFLPSTAICSIFLLVYFNTEMASVYSGSQRAKQEMRQCVLGLLDADRISVRYLRRVVKAQRPFGSKLSIFSFMSVNTAQEVVSNAISYSLLVVSLQKTNV